MGKQGLAPVAGGRVSRARFTRTAMLVAQVKPKSVTGNSNKANILEG